MRQLYSPKDEPYTVSLAQQSNTQENMSYMHYHNIYELYYLVKGQRTYIMNNRAYPLSDDCITLTKPNVIHATKGGFYTRLLIYFSYDFLLRYFTADHVERLLNCFSKDFISGSNIKKNPHIYDLFKTVLKEYKEGREAFAAMHIGELLMELNEVNTTQNEIINYDIIPPVINDILTYIEKNLKNVAGLSDIADAFFFSKYYLAHLFKKHMGMTVTEYLINVRINKAIDLLKNSNLTLTAISNESGFKNSSYFCLVFKKRMNIAPLRYRKAFRKDGLYI